MDEEDYDLCLDSYTYIFQPNLLKGKVAFVTGGGSGICFTITEVLMRHGCQVAIASRNKTRLEKAKQKLEKATGGKCLAVAIDVRKPQDILSAVEKTLEEYGKIDILVNGAAGNFLCPAKDMSFNAFKTVMEIDALGTFNVSKAVYDLSMKKTGGVIINITATLHYQGDALQTHAGSAKAAIEAMTRHLAVEWGPDNIRLLCIAPGPISDTEGFRRLGGPAISDEHIKTIPVQRLGTKEDIANTLMCAVSNACSLLTGSTLVADGGSWLTQSNNYHQRLRLYDMFNRKAKL